MQRLTSELEKNRINELQLHAQSAMHSIRAQLFERQGDARAFALNPNLQQALIAPSETNKAHAVKTLAFLAKIYLVYGNSVLFDLRGRVVATTNSRSFLANSTQLLPNIAAYTQATAFKQNPSLDETFVSDFLASEPQSVQPASPRWQMFTSPIRDEKENLIGFITNYADGLYLKREMESLAEYFRSLNIQSTEVYLVNDKQQTVAGYCGNQFSLACSKVDLPFSLAAKGAQPDKDSLYAWIKYEDPRIKNIPHWTIILKTDMDTYFADNTKIKFFANTVSLISLVFIFLSLSLIYFSRLRAQSVLAKNMLETQEAERSRIAREIHDELGQNLTAVKLFLKSRTNDSPEDLQHRLNEAAEMIDISNDVLRRISHDLHPNLIKNLGLIDSISWKLSELTKHSDFETKFHFENRSAVEKLSDETKGHLYRIFQEALNNFIKHSGGSVFSITLHSDKKALRMILEDNGTSGLKKGQISKDGLGLRSIQERVRLCHGKVQFGTSELGGYSIEVQIPLRTG